jgi:hypothetical protein
VMISFASSSPFCGASTRSRHSSLRRFLSKKVTGCGVRRDNPLHHDGFELFDFTNPLAVLVLDGLELVCLGLNEFEAERPLVQSVGYLPCPR